MNPLWLLLIIPASASVGAVIMGVVSAGRKEDERMGIKHD